MRIDNKIIDNLFSKIKIEKAPSGQYSILKVPGLEFGDYELRYNLSPTDKKTINITVHKGNVWLDGFILKKNCMIQSSAQMNAVRLETI